MALTDIEVRRGLRIPVTAMRWSAVRASGPGGQNVNKRATKVELRVDVDGIEGLHPEARERLEGMAGHRWIDGGELRFVSDDARTQGDNLRACTEAARDLVARAAVRPRKRKATKPTKGSQRRRLDAKKRQGERKRMRRRVERD